MKLKPVFAGWLGVKDSWNFLDYNLDFLDNAARYEIATLNAMGIIGLKASTEILADIGAENIEQHLSSLGNYLIGSMQEVGFKFTGSTKPDERSGIFSFVYKNSQIIDGLHNYLKENRIHIAIRNGALRISPHFYNKESDVETLARTCKNYLLKI